MSNLLRNVRFSLRMLFRHPGITLTVLLTLALGVGANTAIFTVDYATMLAPLPYPNANQLEVVWSKVRGNHYVTSAGDYADWKRENTTFQDMEAWARGSFNLAAAGEQPQKLEGRYLTPGFLRMLGLPMFLGRDFLPEEGEPGHNREVILTHKFWMRLGSNRNIVGTTVRIDDGPYTVVGVLPPGLNDRESDIVVPLAFTPDMLNHDFRFLIVIGRLKPGVTQAQAQADMDSVTRHLAQTYPESDGGWSASVEPQRHYFVSKDEIKTLWLLLGAVGFVLLIACVNVANLLLARSMARQKEIAVRASLGASAKTIFAQLLAESLMLAATGGALGVGAGYAMLRGLIAVMPPKTLPSEAKLSLNVPILLFTLAATTLAGLLFGCVPAWYASRIDPAESLKEGGRAGTGVGRNRLRQALVVGEFALALVLLAGAGLAIHSFWNLSREDLGVRTDHILTFGITLPETRPKVGAKIATYYRQMLASIDAVPGVDSAAVSSSGVPLVNDGFGIPFTIAGGQSYADQSRRPLASFGMVTPDYFKTYGIRVVKGREFSDADNASSVKVAMVDEEFVRRYLRGKDPLTQRIEVEAPVPGVTELGTPAEWQIVGVFRDVRNFLRQDTAEIEVPFWQSQWPDTGIGVRTAEDPAGMLRSVAAAVHAVDPLIALDTPRTMEQVRDEKLAPDRFTLILFATFAAIALLLAAVGIYGVMTFSVEQRSHEIALRMALGATRGRVVGLIVREGLILAAVGLGMGLIGAYFIGRAMQSSLYGVSAMDLRAFAAVGVVLMVAALLACYLPALRAASTEPMKVLRSE